MHWNSTNPIFRIDNTDNIIDVNTKSVNPFDYDQANIVCPYYKEKQLQQEKYVIYSVTKQEYDTCTITNPNPQVIAICNKPEELKYFTITFRSFTPTPGGLEFKPGLDYYFISTSANDDLDERVGGRCSTHNMKITFKIAPSQESSDRRNNLKTVIINSDDDMLRPGRKRGFKAAASIKKTEQSRENSVVYKQEASRMQQSDSGGVSKRFFIWNSLFLIIAHLLF